MPSRVAGILAPAAPPWTAGSSRAWNLGLCVPGAVRLMALRADGIVPFSRFITCRTTARHSAPRYIALSFVQPMSLPILLLNFITLDSCIRLASFHLSSTLASLCRAHLVYSFCVFVHFRCPRAAASRVPLSSRVLAAFSGTIHRAAHKRKHADGASRFFSLFSFIVSAHAFSCTCSLLALPFSRTVAACLCFCCVRHIPILFSEDLSYCLFLRAYAAVANASVPYASFILPSFAPLFRFATTFCCHSKLWIGSLPDISVHSYGCARLLTSAHFTQGCLFRLWVCGVLRLPVLRALFSLFLFLKRLAISIEPACGLNLIHYVVRVAQAAARHSSVASFICA